MSTENRSFLQELIQSGIHWGHQRSRRNPKMNYYIWGYKNDISLLDVSKTASQLQKAAQFLEKTAAEGKTILWVGTKKPAQDIIKAAGTQLNMPWVTHRWIGGTLSNFSQIKKLVTKLLHYEDVIVKAEKYPHYTKKELNLINKEADRLRKNAGGIRGLTWPIGAIVLIDILKERAALKEANRMGVPVVALVDTNADPSMVDFVIPGNDDAPKAIKLVVDYLAQATQKGAQTAENKPVATVIDDMPAENVDLALIEVVSDEEAAAGKTAKPSAARGKRSFEEENRGAKRPVRSGGRTGGPSRK